MSRSSEEVLLVVNNVRHKKSDGSLYMMGERVAWMQAAKDTFTVSHHYADIKCEKLRLSCCSVLYVTSLNDNFVW